MFSIKKSKKGLTLVEIIIGIVLIGIIAISLMPIIPMTFIQTTVSGQRSQAIDSAQSQVEGKMLQNSIGTSYTVTIDFGSGQVFDVPGIIIEGSETYANSKTVVIQAFRPE